MKKDIGEPDYYKGNGFSTLRAFEQGLISQEEYIGFLKGNIIKYTVRAGKKGFAVRDLLKARDYINLYMGIFCMDDDERKEWLAPYNPNRGRDAKAEDVKVSIDVKDDIDMDKLRIEIENALKEPPEFPEIIEVPTDEPNIVKLDLSDVMYDENGELTDEAREKVREYLEELRK